MNMRIENDMLARFNKAEELQQDSTLSQELDFFFDNMFPIAGVILLAVGIGLFISYFVGKKLLAKEIEAEEQALQK